jgi:phosphotransferase system  glucose/maltose/N-acetylglucosamine-specific IIC component
VYVNQQPDLGFWKEAIKAVTTKVKARKQAIKERERSKAEQRALKQQAKMTSPLTAGIGGMSPMMLLGLGAAGVAAFLILRRRRR